MLGLGGTTLLRGVALAIAVEAAPGWASDQYSSASFEEYSRLRCCMLLIPSVFTIQELFPP